MTGIGFAGGLRRISFKRGLRIPIQDAFFVLQVSGKLLRLSAVFAADLALRVGSPMFGRRAAKFRKKMKLRISHAYASKIILT